MLNQWLLEGRVSIILRTREISDSQETHHFIVFSPWAHILGKRHCQASNTIHSLEIGCLS